MPGDNRFYEGNHWHPPVSPRQKQYDPKKQLSTRGRECLYRGPQPRFGRENAGMATCIRVKSTSNPFLQRVNTGRE
eukprot:4043049-Lingulodinium_polyedra.AAC.1